MKEQLEQLIEPISKKPSICIGCRKNKDCSDLRFAKEMSKTGIIFGVTKCSKYEKRA